MARNGCASYLLKDLPPRVDAKTYFAGYVIDSRRESDLATIAAEDARRYAYNAAASFLGAVSSISTYQAAWSVTQLYYSAFYAGRSALCRSKRLIFYVPKPTGAGNTQYELKLHVGERPAVVSRPPSTHKLVAKRFREHCYPLFMTSLEINGSDPILWLMEQREYWQYRAARFPDPVMPDLFAGIDEKRLQRMLESYAADEQGLYLADAEHAILAIPFRLVAWVLSEGSLLSSGAASEEDLAYLRSRCKVGKQQLTVFRRLIA